MTTISEIGQPAIEPEQRRPPPARSYSLVVPLIVLSAIALTVINLGATTYLYRAMNDLRAVDQRLKQLETFEQRIVGRIDAMNTGVQGRLEGMSGELQGQFHQLNQGIAAIKSAPDTDYAREADFPVELEAEAPADDPALLDVPAIAFDDLQAEQAVPAPPIRKKPARSKPQTSSAYERTQAADGKVYYRKVR